jgi:hypothetical protein
MKKTTLEDARTLFRHASNECFEAQLTARRAKSAVQTAERLLAHHLSILVEQGGQWAYDPAQGTTLACAQWAVEQWEEARAAETVAQTTADRATVHAYDLSREVWKSSKSR